MDQHKFLLSGAGGFLGGILNHSLRKMGNPVISMGRGNEEIKVDITRNFSFPEHLTFDVLVHTAGKAHSVPQTDEEKKAFFLVNFEGTKNLCAAVERMTEKPKAFILISTVAVYGVDSGEQITEDYPLKGSTPYAKSKIMAEEWLMDWAKSNGIILGILRLPLLVGYNPH